MAKYCKHCGAELADDASFCPSCGKEVPKPIISFGKPEIRVISKKSLILILIFFAIIVILGLLSK